MTGSLDLQKITHEVCELSRSVRKYLQSEKGKLRSTEIENRGLYDFVSYVDKTLE